MPPGQKITKNMLLEHAFRIAEEQGIMAVTSRSVAKSAGCSIQPVFSQFPTMEELRQETFDYACNLFIKEVLFFEQQPDFFAQSTKWVINLAKNRPHLFQMLYLSDGFKGNNFLDVIMGYESNQKILAKMADLYHLEESVCKDILLRSCLFLTGIGTMICVNHMDFDNEQVSAMMKQTVADMVQGAKHNSKQVEK